MNNIFWGNSDDRKDNRDIGMHSSTNSNEDKDDQFMFDFKYYNVDYKSTLHSNLDTI